MLSSHPSGDREDLLRGRAKRSAPFSKPLRLPTNGDAEPRGVCAGTSAVLRSDVARPPALHDDFLRNRPAMGVEGAYAEANGKVVVLIAEL